MDATAQHACWCWSSILFPRVIYHALRACQCARVKEKRKVRGRPEVGRKEKKWEEGRATVTVDVYRLLTGSIEIKASGRCGARLHCSYSTCHSKCVITPFQSLLPTGNALRTCFCVCALCVFCVCALCACVFFVCVLCVRVCFLCVSSIVVSFHIEDIQQSFISTMFPIYCGL